MGPLSLIVNEKSDFAASAPSSVTRFFTTTNSPLVGAGGVGQSPNDPLSVGPVANLTATLLPCASENENREATREPCALERVLAH